MPWTLPEEPTIPGRALPYSRLRLRARHLLCRARRYPDRPAASRAPHAPQYFCNWKWPEAAASKSLASFCEWMKRRISRPRAPITFALAALLLPATGRYRKRRAFVEDEKTFRKRLMKQNCVPVLQTITPTGRAFIV